MWFQFAPMRGTEAFVYLERSELILVATFETANGS